MLEKSSKKTTPAKKRQPEQRADSKVANVVVKKNSDSKTEAKDRLKSSSDTKKPRAVASQASSSKKSEVGFVEPKAADKAPVKPKKVQLKWWPWLLLLPIWTYTAFLIAQAVVFGVAWAAGQAGVTFDSVNPAVLVTVLTSIVYTLAIFIAVLVPYKLWRKKTTRVEIGLPDFPRWLDILLAVLTFVVYLVTSGIVVMLLTTYLPIELNDNQQLPFDQSMLTSKVQYWLAFVTLVMVVPFAEELLFRGYLYGKLRKATPVWLAILATSIAFSLAHLWAPGSPLQIMVAIDTFVLSIFLCLLREYTGAIWAAFLVHAIKNGLAFYVLFVNPFMLDSIQAAVVSLF